MRRVGLGGHCPHCDEPIAITDLLEEVIHWQQPTTRNDVDPPGRANIQPLQKGSIFGRC
jgi:hypothetical protein